MTCRARHTKYQPTIDEWECPKCGERLDGKDGGFIIDGVAEGALGDCDLLHVNDELLCSSCKYISTGKKFSALLQRKHNLIPCPHCKGTGLVKMVRMEELK
jgi:Zn finger protein HypA/HybF involved in hydrogenase expression